MALYISSNPFMYNYPIFTITLTYAMCVTKDSLVLIIPILF